MANRETYARQVALLMRILPLLAEEEVFALKGGTAINLFVRDAPRLSVDLDLTYLPVQSYEESVTGIDAAMRSLAERIRAAVPRSQVRGHPPDQPLIQRLHVQTPAAAVKIEVTPVLRGVVYPPEVLTVAAGIEREFGFAEARVVSMPDLYAGKIVAALDRQHPRDLFDVMLLLDNEGISDELREAFIVYLLSSAKPLRAILNPPDREIAAKYEAEFVGMTRQAVSLDSLLEARARLKAAIVDQMPQVHRRFLMGFKAGETDWALLQVPEAANLPAVRLRMEKLAALPPEDRAAQVEQLRRILFP